MNNYEELIERLGNYLSSSGNDEAIEAIKQLLAERNELRDQITEVPQIMRELTAERAECEEQARLNGMGAEREAALLAKVDGLERELTATQHVVAQYAEGERKLRAELAAKTKELADAIDTLVKERDELVAAIKEVIDDAEECLDHDEWTAMLVSLDAFHNLSTAYEAALAKLGAEVTASME